MQVHRSSSRTPPLTTSAQVYERFDGSYHTTWLPTVKILSEIDCLVSLARSSAALGDDACRPEFVESPHAFLDFEGLRHPCVNNTTDFIPNDVKIGDGDGPRMVLLSGPNMCAARWFVRSKKSTDGAACWPGLAKAHSCVLPASP